MILPDSVSIQDMLDEIGRRTKLVEDRLCGKLNEAVEDYNRVVSKFDECRGALAAEVEAHGFPSNLPDNYKGAWHEYLIELLANLRKQ